MTQEDRMGRFLRGGDRKEVGSYRRDKIQVVLGQSPHWTFCSLGKGCGPSPFPLPEELQRRRLWNCQVISGLGRPFKASSITAKRL